jgi:deoxyribodipyrimidine photo-lyase
MADFRLSIHLFQRDLRLHDNTALLAALKQSEQVMPIFVFDERQLDNPFRGNNSFEFMVNSLVELDGELKEMGSQLYFFRGIAHEVVDQLLELTKAEAVFVNRDYTPFSRERDEQIGKVCQNNKVNFFSYADALLTEPEQVQKNDGRPYTIYTPFMKRARLLTIPSPLENRFTNYFNKELQLSDTIDSPKELCGTSNPNLLLKGGRREALNRLTEIGRLEKYDDERNLPAVKGTSLLSAHQKFGTVSIRETYHKIIEEFSAGHTLINELFWRDFFTHIAFHFPHIFGNSFNRKYTTLGWENDEKKFERWCNGQTGFPIVDAGMRELTATGYMHNRVRMIVASFMTKDLHIDWRWGERFFANHLIDYDPAVNNGNWQWAASTGCDAQPYFRIFNPWSQQQRFDPECIYIKKWVPELAKLSAKEIHQLNETQTMIFNYPNPMVNHGRESVIAKEMFSKLKKDETLSS